MNEDLKKAYELAKEESAQNAEITPVFLQKLNAALMRTTGSVYNVMGGSFDSSKGEFRLCLWWTCSANSFYHKGKKTSIF